MHKLAMMTVVALGTALSCGCAESPAHGASALEPGRAALAPAHGAPLVGADAPERAVDLMRARALAQRAKWRDLSFEEFEKATYKEPFAGGKYIVSGDVAIADRRQLEEFFRERIQSADRETAGNKLIVYHVGGIDVTWNSVQKRQLTYCLGKSLGALKAKVAADMLAATRAWEAVSDVKFRHVSREDAHCDAANGKVVFDVQIVDAGGAYLARAFFPNDSRAARNVYIDRSATVLPADGKLQLVGILRHELGHTLGWRHEHTRPESGACFEDGEWRVLTDYDALSVMHYPQCNGGGDWSLALTPSDKDGAACIYGRGPKSGPLADACRVPVVAADGVKPKVEQYAQQIVALGEMKKYGPFAARAGTIFEVDMSAAGTHGDPDLYVRAGMDPDIADHRYNCRPLLTGANESCAIDVPKLTAPYDKVHVAISGHAAGSFNLTVKYVPAN